MINFTFLALVIFQFFIPYKANCEKMKGIERGEFVEMLKVAVKASVDAGKAILVIYEQDFDIEYKEDESPLTSADMAAHKIIETALTSSSPFPVLSEESGKITYEERSKWKTYWLVDPLDGTKEFIKKNGEFTVNIALVENGIPTIGIVYVPVTETLYYGSDEGAFKAVGGKHFESAIDLLEAFDNNFEKWERLDLSNGRKFGDGEKLRVVASKSHCNEETKEFIGVLEKKYGEIEMVSRGSSLKLCMVAEGTADIYPRIAPTMEWDTAAADAVVRAAGGKVFKYDKEVSPENYLIGNEKIEVLPYNKKNLLNPFFVVSGLKGDNLDEL